VIYIHLSHPAQSFFVVVLAVLEFELRASCLWGKHTFEPWSHSTRPPVQSWIFIAIFGRPVKTKISGFFSLQERLTGSQGLLTKAFSETYHYNLSLFTRDVGILMLWSRKTDSWREGATNHRSGATILGDSFHCRTSGKVLGLPVHEESGWWLDFSSQAYFANAMQ
jgi:hypothetical protein